MLKTPSMDKVYSVFSKENQKHASIYGDVQHSRSQAENPKKKAESSKHLAAKRSAEALLETA